MHVKTDVTRAKAIIAADPLCREDLELREIIARLPETARAEVLTFRDDCITDWELSQGRDL